MATSVSNKSLLVSYIREIEQAYGVKDGSSITTKEAVEALLRFRKVNDVAVRAAVGNSITDTALKVSLADSISTFNGEQMMSFVQFRGIFTLVNKVLKPLMQKCTVSPATVRKIKLVFLFLQQLEQKNIGCLKSLPYRILRLIVLLIVDQQYYAASVFISVLIHQATMEVFNESVNGPSAKG